MPIVIPDDIARQATQIVRLLKPRTAPVLDLQRFERQQGVSASVNLSELTTVIERDGTWRTAAVYRIKNRSRQFLALWIPEEAQILSVFVQDQAARPVEAERAGKKMYLVALPKVSAADLSASVKVVLAGRIINAPLPKGIRLTAQEIDLPAPQVVSTQDDAEYGLPVAKTQWTVYLPDDLDVKPVDDRNRNNLEPVHEEEVVLAKEEWLYREAKELSSLLLPDNGYSMRSKQQAFNNLKQIQRNLDNYESLRGEAKGRQVDAKKSEKLEEQRKVLDSVIASNGALGVQMDAVQVDVDALNYRQLREQSESLIRGNTINGIQGQATEDEKQPIMNFSKNLFESELVERNSDESKKRASGTEAQSRSKRMAQSKENLDVLQQQQQLQLEIRQSQTVTESNLSRGGAMGGSFGRGGMGGMGGGFGIGGMGGGGIGGVTASPAEPLGELSFDDAQGYFSSAGNQTGASWTQHGGLSLPIDLPTSGQKIVFSKVTGSPKLALSLRTRETVATGVGLVWTLVWFAAAFAIVVSIIRYHVMSQVFYRLPEFFMAIGVVGFFLSPSRLTGLAVVFLTMFVIGVISLAVRRRRALA